MIGIKIDMGSLLTLNESLKPKINAALKQAAESLSAQAYGHLLEQVQKNLHSTRSKYVDALSFKKVGASTWIINLDHSAMWIEDGMPEHEMLDNLLKSPKAKRAKDGSRYLVVPFQHNKGPTSQTQAAQDLTATIKRELKQRQIPYGKIETDEHGKPKLGLLHSFDITKKPVKTHDGPGQGHGPIGEVRQGTTGIPFLQSIRIYQKEVKGKVKRGIMTFRVASSKHKGSGKWIHPGLEPRNFFDETANWALQQWDKIRVEVTRNLTDSL
jgi:hypothetical protein